MKRRALKPIGVMALLLASAAPLMAAVDYAATMHDLKLPVFDAADHLIRRLTAKIATGSLASSRLENGQVEFFAPVSADHAIAVLDFDQAQYTSATERIEGDKTLTFTTKEGTARGVGFTCELKTGLLTLQSAVKFDSEDLHLAGDHGDIHYDPKSSGGEPLITEAVVTGRVVVTRSATAKAPFDRAETTAARYSAGEQKVFLKLPMTVWAHGQRGVMEKSSGAEFFEITLKEKPVPASGHE